MRTTVVTISLLLPAVPALASGGAVDQLLQDYQTAGAASPEAQRGQAMWTHDVITNGEQRSCASCHTADLRNSGKHAKTGKVIKPLAPSVNPARLTRTAEIEKWFGRNCKWTYGRACTPNEKADFLLYMQNQ